MVGRLSPLRLLPSDAETAIPASTMTASASRKLPTAVTALCRRAAVCCRTCFEIMFPPPNDYGKTRCADAPAEYPSRPWRGTSHDRAISYFLVGRASGSAFCTGDPRGVDSPWGSEQ